MIIKRRFYILIIISNYSFSWGFGVLGLSLRNVPSDGPDELDRFNFTVGGFIFRGAISAVGGLLVNHHTFGAIAIDHLVVDAQGGKFTILTSGQPPLVAIAKGQRVVAQPRLARRQVRGIRGD